MGIGKIAPGDLILTAQREGTIVEMVTYQSMLGQLATMLYHPVCIMKDQAERYIKYTDSMSYAVVIRRETMAEEHADILRKIEKKVMK